MTLTDIDLHVDSVSETDVFGPSACKIRKFADTRPSIECIELPECKENDNSKICSSEKQNNNVPESSLCVCDTKKMCSKKNVCNNLTKNLSDFIQGSEVLKLSNCQKSSLCVQEYDLQRIIEKPVCEENTTDKENAVIGSEIEKNERLTIVLADCGRVLGETPSLTFSQCENSTISRSFCVEEIDMEEVIEVSVNDNDVAETNNELEDNVLHCTSFTNINGLTVDLIDCRSVLNDATSLKLSECEASTIRQSIYLKESDLERIKEESAKNLTEKEQSALQQITEKNIKSLTIDLVDCGDVLRNRASLKLSECSPSSIKRSLYVKENDLKQIKEYSECAESEFEKEYTVEKIVLHFKNENNEFEYLVKWRGYKLDDSSWEKSTSLENCQHLLLEYLEEEKPGTGDLFRLERKLENDQGNTHVEYLLMALKNVNEIPCELFTEIKAFVDGSFFTKTHVQIIKQSNMCNVELKLLLRCIFSMKENPDPFFVNKAKKLILMKKVCKLRATQLKSLNLWSTIISHVEKIPIRVENKIDFEHNPRFDYISESIPGEDVVIPYSPGEGCKCVKCSPASICCGSSLMAQFGYTSHGKVRVVAPTPIYECNDNCFCDETCSNRVVQKGVKVPVCIFKTQDCGWGVKAVRDIQKNVFICEYVGEVINEAVAIVRDINNVKTQQFFMFELDVKNDGSIFCIDGTKIGNFSRLFNHSCRPNMEVYAVWINCLDPKLPRVAFFTTRKIKKGEELCFDYENLKPREQTDVEQKLKTLSSVKCRCNSSNCRGYLFFGKPSS